MWWLRYDAPATVATTGVFGFEIVALLLGATGGWLGGELVDRRGVGVDNGANLNAPNSITRRSAKAA